MAQRLQQEEQFDRNRRFTVKRRFKVSGQVLEPGTDFDNTWKDRVTTRTMRQLWEQRFLAMEPFGSLQEAGAHSLTAYLADLTDSQLRDWLALRGKVPRMGVKREKLLEQAEQVLKADAAQVAA